ncbi:extracellular matrix protein 2 isoform X2 [Denticeps clupeoides]|uniref:extracellular matrix protein 2 isoform X2 n=1 Tax=Denticeps clupeoides TaxID=299321 RepID=UPI0010A47281|nr:extracellular matrix protein 2 isoform X2 [Denticeps clupeoides]
MLGSERFSSWKLFVSNIWPFTANIEKPAAMRRRFLLTMWFMVCLALVSAQEQTGPLGRGRRRKAEQKRQRRLNPGPLVRHGRAPVHSGDEGAAIFLESYKSISNQESNYNVLPASKTGQCQYMGITMYEKAVWSPKPCLTCLCSSGSVVCDEVACPPLRCPLSMVPIGECCPVCVDPVPNDPSESDPTDLIRQHHIKKMLKQEEVHEEENRFHKEVEKKKRKKEKAERKLREKEQKRKEEEERKLREEAEEAVAAEERKRREEEQKWQEGERVRRIEMEHKEMLQALEEVAQRAEEEEQREQEEEEEFVWLRGDVFQMPPSEPTAAAAPPPFPEPLEHTDETEDEDVPEIGGETEEGTERVTHSLPAGCTISDVIVTCENAKLTSIPPLSIPELKSLSLEGNAITAIPAEAFNGIPNLERITLSKNLLTSKNIHPRAFKSLRFLNRLYMDGNLLEQIPSDLPPTLQELKINENKLREIDENSFEGLNNLITLELEDNVLSEGNMDPQAFSPLRQLLYLRLGRNHFRTVPQGLPPSLLELYLENNMIEEISQGAFNQTSNLNVVVLRHNKIDETRIAPLAWIYHRNLESIDLSHNKLYLVPSFLPKSLVHLVLVGNQIERIPGYVFAHMEPGLEYLYLSFNKLDSEGVEPESFLGCHHSMTELCLDHNQLTSVPIGINEMPFLHFLRLNNNKIRTIAEDSICDPLNEEDSHLVALRLENNVIDPRKIPPMAFSCVRSYSSVVLKPQKNK